MNYGSKEKNEKYSAVDVVIRHIEALVVTKQLKPGDRVPTEMELSKELNLGRSSIREAIKILEANGLLSIRRGDGTYISDIEDVQFSMPLLYQIILLDALPRELMEFREEMELSILRLAIKNADEQDLENIVRSHQKFKEYSMELPRNIDRMARMDYEFHNNIALGAKNRYYQQLFRFTMNVFLPKIIKNYELGQNPQESLEAHEQMLEALLARDLVMAEKAIKDMVRTWANWVLKQ